MKARARKAEGFVVAAPAKHRTYAERIADAIAGTPSASADPAVVECWMRLEHGTLDQLDRVRFDREARTCAKMALDYPKESRDLAASYGVKVGGAA